jgi:hypothetical protein
MNPRSFDWFLTTCQNRFRPQPFVISPPGRFRENSRSRSRLHARPGSSQTTEAVLDSPRRDQFRATCRSLPRFPDPASLSFPAEAVPVSLASIRSSISAQPFPAWPSSIPRSFDRTCPSLRSWIDWTLVITRGSRRRPKPTACSASPAFESLALCAAFEWSASVAGRRCSPCGGTHFPSTSAVSRIFSAVGDQLPAF